jgi:hypothetical protein
VYPIIILLFCISLPALADEAVSDDNRPDDQPTHRSNPLWIDDTMERIVIPIQKWLDKDPDKSKKQQDLLYASSMRSAIKSALAKYNGTVLSAAKNNDHFAIKILSKSGIVKIIKVPLISRPTE